MAEKRTGFPLPAPPSAIPSSLSQPFAPDALTPPLDPRGSSSRGITEPPYATHGLIQVDLYVTKLDPDPSWLIPQLPNFRGFDHLSQLFIHTIRLRHQVLWTIFRKRVPPIWRGRFRARNSGRRTFTFWLIDVCAKIVFYVRIFIF